MREAHQGAIMHGPLGLASPASQQDLALAITLLIIGATLIWVVGNRVRWAPVVGGAAIAISLTIGFCLLIAP
jgi:hypothetical protein